MSSHLPWHGINPSRSICWQRRSRARSNRCSVMPGTFKEWIRSGVTGREHAYATSSSIGALSQCECPAGIFLVDLRGETRFACTAGAAGSGGGGVTGLPGAEMPGAIEGAGGTMAADTTGLPGAGPPGVVGGAGVTLVAGTTWFLAAAPAEAVEGSAALAPRSGFAGTGAPGAAEGAGGNIGAGTTGWPGAGGGAILAARRTTRMPAVRPPGAVGGAGVTLVA